MKIFALISLTFRELVARLTIIILAGISTVIIIFTLLSVSARETPDGLTLLVFGNPASAPVPADQFAGLVRLSQAGLAGGLFVGIILFGVFATAGVIPDTLDKGTVELFLSKPMARWELLLGRYLGAVAVVLANVIYFIGALWCIMGVRLGVWNTAFLLSSFTITFVFAALFSVVSLLGVLTRNTAIAVIGAFLYLIVVASGLYHRETLLFLFSDNSIYRGGLDLLYYILPQTSALQDAVQQHIVQQTIDWKPFAQSFLSSAGIFLLGAFFLHRKDF